MLRLPVRDRAAMQSRRFGGPGSSTIELPSLTLAAASASKRGSNNYPLGAH
jgi:hypothetical protein